MIKFPTYRPTLLLCVTITVSLFILVGIHEPDTISTSEFIALTVLKGVQCFVLLMTLCLELRIHINRKKRYYSTLRHYHVLLSRVQLWESEKYTPQMILHRYYATFQFFETSLKSQQDRTYKKYDTKLRAVQGEYDRLRHCANLTHDDLHDFKLSVKTLLF